MDAVMWWAGLAAAVVIGCVAAGVTWRRHRAITIDPISERHTAEMRKHHP